MFSCKKKSKIHCIVNREDFLCAKKSIYGGKKLMNHKINGLRMWRMDGFTGKMAAREEKLEKNSLIRSIRLKNSLPFLSYSTFMSLYKSKMRN